MRRRGFPYAYAALLALVYAVLAAREIRESDALWHAELGRTVLRQHTRTVVEPMAIGLLARVCIVHEWLWDVVTFLLQKHIGWVGVELLVVGCAGLVALSFVLGLRSWTRERSLAAVAAATAVLSPAVLSRVRERPEIVAMALLPVVIAVSRGLARDGSVAAARRRIVWLGVVSLFWAQTHAAFVLAPVVTAVVAGPELVRRGRRLQAVALAAVYLLVLASSPYGANLLTVLAAHGSGFSGQHITEWQPPTFALFDPSDRPPFPLYGLSWLLLVAAALLRRRVPRRETALALVGVLLVLRGRRGIGPAAILDGPALAWAFDAIFAALAARRRTWRGAWAAAVIVPSLTWGAVDSALREGAPLRFGLAPELSAPGGLAALATLPPGTRALTTYTTGAIVGFGLDGQVRTFVDSRTPLIFGDADLAMAFQVWTDPAALARAAAHYDLSVAMVGRDEPSCALLADGGGADGAWTLVGVDRRVSTFARANTAPASTLPPLVHLAACGASYVPENACADGPAAIGDELARVHDVPFAAYLTAEASVACAHGHLDADAIVAALPAVADSEGFLPARAGLHAWVLASAGRTRDAVDEVLALDDGPAKDAALARVAPVLAAGVARARPGTDGETNARAVRDLLAPWVDAPANDAPPWAWAALANACAALGDIRCTETNALRAAASGLNVAPALCAMITRSRDAAVRDDARAWLDTLRREHASTSGGENARSLDCPP